ncbi:longitudinals lacking protein, isoforms A/B/D/L isoform X2 [Calliphora vicina]|uniref:longitudinals lacking protein, isoforms A/B/D/L isoform X2 n=1 Tax=Calliphora vicina TaxID=7373 RepID=UPI00325AFB2E
MDDDQQFCLRWNNHQSTLISVFDTLLENETLVDCTLAAEGKFLKAHKVVLSACSPYFATLLQEQYDKHPIFILKDVKYQELRAMMDYMYRGEVNISQDQLAALLKAAESLQIKGLSDNRSGGGTTAPKPEHHRATMPTGKLSAGYTLEQTKRARIAGPAEPEMGSREGSSSPSRRRRKVRRRSIENAMTEVHDNSNSSQQLQQQQTQSNASGLGAITAAASALAAAAAAAPNTQSLASNVPLSATTSSSTAVTAPGTTLSSSKKTDIVKGTTQQQQHTQQQQQDAMNTENVQGPASAATAAGSLDTESTDAAATTATDKSNHKQMQQQLKQAKESISAGASGAASASDLVIEPKAEYDDEANDEPVEDLTLDEEDMGMDDLDQNAGTSQGGEGSSQGYAPWQHDRSQDELLLATQEAQQRDPQGSSSTESYWTIVETVPYTLANSQTNGGTAAVTNVISTHGHHHHQVQQHNNSNIHHHHQQQQHQQPSQQHHHHQQHQQHVATATDAANLLGSATVVVEIPSDTVGMPGSTIHYTLPKGTTTTDHQQILRNVQTSSALTTTYAKLTNPPATIQIVKHTNSNNPQQQTITRITTPETLLPDAQAPTQVQHQQVQHITLQECLDATTTNVLQQQQQQHHQQQHHHHQVPAQHIQQTTTAISGGGNQQHNATQIQQEYIKIDTSRFEDKVLLRNVVQYEQQQQQQQQHQPQHQTVSITTTTPTTTSNAPQATIIVNEATAKDLHHQQEQQHVQHQQEQQQQHEQLLAESVTTSASEADDLEDLTELKPLVTNHSVIPLNNSSNPLATPSSHHDTSESDNEKFLTPPKRIKTGILKPSDIAAAGLQYVCNVCGKSYKIKGSLKRHKNYECGVAPGLSCPYCPHKCKYKSDLRKHISQKHALNITTTNNNRTI